MPDDGLITLRSAHSARETIARLEAALDAKGITAFAKIDHAAWAVAVGLPLLPTTLIIFGSPRACTGTPLELAIERSGTPLMQTSQLVGIDLPSKALVWEDGEGTVWLTYNDPSWVARRHASSKQYPPVLGRMRATLPPLHRLQQKQVQPREDDWF
jgi:uncharacterized protein (DUF302 family)